MNSTEEPLDLVADLRPAQLDQLADRGYDRRRHLDMARATAESRTRPGVAGGPGRRRWPVSRPVLAAGIAVVAAAAAVAAVRTVAPSASGPGTPPGAAPATSLGARSFLLASATVAERAPAAAGSYWYIKERDYEPDWAAAKGIRPKPDHGTAKADYGATSAETEESWNGSARTRTVVGEDLVISFASSSDKARWLAAGKPPLATAAGSRSVTSNYNMAFYWGPDRNRLSLAGVRRLPATASGLGAVLRRMWNSDADKAAVVGLPHPTFADYVFEWADALLTGPATPGTKAAVYRLLADQPGVSSTSPVTDPLGRTGVAIADGEGYGGRDYMIVDPQTAQILAYTTAPVHADEPIPTALGGTEVYEVMGWASQIGIPAQP
jgi:hypothetical protein